MHQQADFQVRRGYQLTGVVLDRNGGPLTEGMVTIRPLDGGSPPASPYVSTGRFSRPFLPGRYAVRLDFDPRRNPGQLSQELGVVELAADTTVTWHLAPGEPFLGRIVDGAGNGVPDVHVAAECEGNGTASSAWTGPGGGFRLELTPGEYGFTASVRRSGAQVSWPVGGAQAPSADTVTFALPSGAILRGRVLRQQDPAPGARVCLLHDATRDHGAAANRAAETSTTDDGWFELEAGPGDYALAAYPPDMPGRSYPALRAVRPHLTLAGERELDIALPAPASLHQLSGTVSRRGAPPPASGSLQFYDAVQGVAATAALSDSSYRLALPPGSYAVRITLRSAAGQTWESTAGPLLIDRDRVWDLVIQPDGTAVTYGQGTRPYAFALRPGFPNPFNARVTIPYEVPVRSPVKLNVYDVLGRRVRSLVNTVQDPGRYHVGWDGVDDRGRTAGTGVYLVRLQAGCGTACRKLLLLR